MAVQYIPKIKTNIASMTKQDLEDLVVKHNVTLRALEKLQSLFRE